MMKGLKLQSLLVLALGAVLGHVLIAELIGKRVAQAIVSPPADTSGGNTA